MKKNKETLIFQDVGRYIEADIKREVRKRCGFGCVVCGNPIIQYDHMKEWSKVHEHKADDITLLCPNHHMEATAGRMPRGKVLAFNENPYNKNALLSQPHTLYYYGDQIDFILGNNTFKGNFQVIPSFSPLVINGRNILAAKKIDDLLLLDVEIIDEYGNIVLCIKENELIFSLNNWDIQFAGKTLQINEKASKPRIIISFSPPNRVVIEKAILYYHGILVDITKAGLTGHNGSSSLVLNNCIIENCFVGLLLE